MNFFNLFLNKYESLSISKIVLSGGGSHNLTGQFHQLWKHSSEGSCEMYSKGSILAKDHVKYIQKEAN